jgi:DNA-binding transcriptional MerR regulator
MDLNQHPLSIPEVNALMQLFLVDVIDDYRDQEIKEWLQGLSVSDIEAILQRPEHQHLKDNPFVIPFIYLHYAVVPPPALIASFWQWLQIHPLLPLENIVLQNTKKHFQRIFTGKTSYIHQI